MKAKIISDYAIIFPNTKGDTHVRKNHQPGPSHYWCRSAGIIVIRRPDRDRLVPWNAFFADRRDPHGRHPAWPGTLFPLCQSDPEEIKLIACDLKNLSITGEVLQVFSVVLCFFGIPGPGRPGNNEKLPL